MSKSFRDNERRISKKLGKALTEAVNKISPEMNTLIEDIKKSKEIHRYGNKRKAKALEKVLKRRIERRKGFDSDAEF